MYLSLFHVFSSMIYLSLLIIFFNGEGGGEFPERWRNRFPLLDSEFVQYPQNNFPHDADQRFFFRFGIFVKKGRKNFFWIKKTKKKGIFGKFSRPPKFWNPKRGSNFPLKGKKKHWCGPKNPSKSCDLSIAPAVPKIK